MAGEGQPWALWAFLGPGLACPPSGRTRFMWAPRPKVPKMQLQGAVSRSGWAARGPAGPEFDSRLSPLLGATGHVYRSLSVPTSDMEQQSLLPHGTVRGIQRGNTRGEEWTRRPWMGRLQTEPHLGVPREGDASLLKACPKWTRSKVIDGPCSSVMQARPRKQPLFQSRGSWDILMQRH